MIAFTNSEGLVITHTTGFLETVLLHLNSGSTYNTPGENGNIFIEIGSNKVLPLDYT